MLRVHFVFRRVTPPGGSNSAELSRRARFLAAFAGVGLLAALLLASQLQPDPRGWGTHEQLGLPPCTFLSVVGIRCPACGMTTAWANVTHGRPLDALKANASGALLAVVALAAGVWTLSAAARGRWPAWRPTEMTMALGAVALTGMVLCEWTLRVLAER
jgi:hypothetical protein